MLHIVMLEDTPEEAATLRAHLERYATERGLELSITWLTSALDYLEDRPAADLIFMDIDMPGINGLEAAHQLRVYDSATPLVFVTNLAQYAVRGYIFVLFAQYEMLFAQRLRAEATAAERLVAEQQRQYNLSRENIEAINIKCHDIRHQIRHLGETGTAVDAAVLADIAREVSVYDATVRTGNEALDTILTEKRLVCEGEGITLTCMADGHALDFLAPAELYALFGNALDNAIEATRRVPEGGRSISVNVRQAMGMAVIHVENTCAGTAVFVDGLPQTTKRAASGARDTANHGIGTRSMRALAERHDGLFSAAQRGDVFCLDITLPLPE